MDKFFHPNSIAIIGASRDPNKVGHVILTNLLRAGYPGKVYPVNPNADKIAGLQAYPSVLHVKGTIDLAVIALPKEKVYDAIRDCAKKNIKHAIMITAGFSETGNKNDEEKLRKLLHLHHIRMIGPNCLGHLNTHAKINTLFLPQVRLQTPKPGSISFITQSGALGSVLLDIMAQDGTGIAKFISYGNALDINENHLLHYLANDPHTKVICAYLEGLNNGRTFLHTAKTITKKKPLIVLKGGTTDAGAHAVTSHTAALAGSAPIFTAACKQARIIQAERLEELSDYAKALDKSPPPKGNKVQIITNGGGYGILTADAAATNGLSLAQLSPSSVKRLGKTLPAEAILKNPLDVTGSATTEHYHLALDVCMNDKHNDVLLVILLLQTPLLTIDLVNTLRDYYEQKKKPIIAIVPGGNFAHIHKKHLQESGVPTYTFPENAIKATKALCDYHLKK